MKNVKGYDSIRSNQWRIYGGEGYLGGFHPPPPTHTSPENVRNVQILYTSIILIVVGLFLSATMKKKTLIILTAYDIILLVFSTMRVEIRDVAEIVDQKK